MDLKNFGKIEIDLFTQNFEELFYKEDFVGIASYYADDAKILAENTDLIQGHEQIERFWQISCEDGNKIGMKRILHVQDFETSGNLGYLNSNVKLLIPELDNKVLNTIIMDVTV